MDRRLYEISQMQKFGEVKNSHQCREENIRQPACGCLDTDFCVPTPENMNGGILTMAFVDIQPLESVYGNEDALRCGTLFPNLNKPFYGGKC